MVEINGIHVKTFRYTGASVSKNRKGEQKNPDKNRKKERADAVRLCINKN